jgi:hypothetical protein
MRRNDGRRDDTKLAPKIPAIKPDNTRDAKGMRAKKMIEGVEAAQAKLKPEHDAAWDYAMKMREKQNVKKN